MGTRICEYDQPLIELIGIDAACDGWLRILSREPLQIGGTRLRLRCSNLSLYVIASTRHSEAGVRKVARGWQG
jgi:hypothetical protein